MHVAAPRRQKRECGRRCDDVVVPTTMNARQRVVLKVGLVVFVLMGLFPPWRVTLYRMPWEVLNDEPQLVVTYRYRFVADAPAVRVPTVQKVEFAWARLRYQWMLLCLAVIFLLILLRSRHGGGDGHGGDGSGHFAPDDPILAVRRPVLHFGAIG